MKGFVSFAALTQESYFDKIMKDNILIWLRAKFTSTNMDINDVAALQGDYFFLVVVLYFFLFVK